jgi:hypothetical protein
LLLAGTFYQAAKTFSIFDVLGNIAAFFVNKRPLWSHGRGSLDRG